MKGRFKDCLKLSGGEWLVSFTTREDPGRIYEKLKDTDISVEIKKHTVKRSKTANDFCWALCTDIGNALRPPLPKEMVYRQAIRDVGKHELYLMKNEAVETFMRVWGDRGTGWFAEKLDDSKKNPGCTLVFAYFGTSVYDSAEMSRVIDYLKAGAENMGLKIPFSKAEEKRMLAEWGKCG